MRIYQMGNMCVQLHPGIPIGGPISAQMLHAFLSASEHRIHRWTWRRFFPGESGAEHLHQIVTVRRYVDDVLVHSKWVCSDCAKQLISGCYSPHISFDPACDGQRLVGEHNVIKYIDLFIGASWDATYVHVSCKIDS